jgi:hypothetical protein
MRNGLFGAGTFLNCRAPNTLLLAPPSQRRGRPADVEANLVKQTEKIMIIRHGEKPGVPVAADGIDINGIVNPESLTAAGWHRAHALVKLFHPHKAGSIRKGLAVPEHLYACSDKGATSSERPIETITPLAESFDQPLAIDSSIDAKNVDAIAVTARNAKGIVLICWRHEEIVAIANAIAPGERIPKRWPGSRFDMVWIFEARSNGSYRFSQLPELVMPGDSKLPIA